MKRAIIVHCWEGYPGIAGSDCQRGKIGGIIFLHETRFVV